MKWPTRTGWPTWGAVAPALCVVLFLFITGPGLGFDAQRLAKNAGNFFEFLSKLFQQPDVAYLPRLLGLLGETLAIAFIATVYSIVIAVPISFAIARNTGLPVAIRAVLKTLFAMGRAVPDMVWALFMVSAVGLGVLPGLLALVITSVVFLAKVYAEAIEVADPKPVEGLRAVGANAMGVRLVGVAPQVAPDFVSLGCYMFDVNIRAAAILGLVGAGGIGFDLSQSLRLFQYDRLGLILLSIYLLVTLVDRLSMAAQRRLTT